MTHLLPSTASPDRTDALALATWLPSAEDHACVDAIERLREADEPARLERNASIPDDFPGDDLLDE